MAVHYCVYVIFDIVHDKTANWRIVYRIDDDAIVLLEVFSKKTGKTPKRIIDLCKKRMKDYDDA